MENKTQGAWLIHHTKKLLDMRNTQDFEDIELAGKCGIFLSNLAASHEQSDLNEDKVSAIAKVSNIKKTELETIKHRLVEAHLIDITKNKAVSVLGVTTASVLSHTSGIFHSLSPTSYQKAAIELAENISDLPKAESELKEYISDVYKLNSGDVIDLFSQSEDIGFVDYEKLDNQTKLYFNGNLFRRENVKKTNTVLSSLKQDDMQKVLSLDLLLNEEGCVTLEKVRNILGEQLLAKLHSIGMYDFSEVSNLTETKTFVTKPSAFSKYGNPFEEDAMDLAKAFVSSLYYGMNFSSTGRGKISMLKALMQKLINGYEVGPATAIGQDYKLLELKRVIKIRHEGGYHYYMKLLKRDIGELAMQVLESGNASESAIQASICSDSVISYIGPEQKRISSRKKQNEPSKKSVTELLRTFRS